MKGYRTIIANVLMAIASILVLWGIEVTPEQIEVISTGIVTVFTVGNLIMRKLTTTPMGQKE